MPLKRVPVEIIDFHSHILPRMDDGSDSSKTSVEMLRRSAQAGVTWMIATPHFYGHRTSLEHFLERRQASAHRLASVMRKGMPKVSLGAEVALYAGIEDLDGIEKLCIQNTNLLLLEMPFAPWTGYDVDILANLALNQDLQIVLAHFERFYDMQKDENLLNRVLELPVYLQINAGALLPMFGSKRWLEWLSQGKAHLLGSDCHNLGNRAPNLDLARKKIEKKIGRETLQRIDMLGTSLMYQKQLKNPLPFMGTMGKS